MSKDYIAVMRFSSKDLQKLGHPGKFATWADSPETAKQIVTGIAKDLGYSPLSVKVKEIVR